MLYSENYKISIWIFLHVHHIVYLQVKYIMILLLYNEVVEIFISVRLIFCVSNYPAKYWCKICSNLIFMTILTRRFITFNNYN